MAIATRHRVHKTTRGRQRNDQGGCRLNRIVRLSFPQGVQNCHWCFSTQMAVGRACRRSAEASERGRRATGGNSTCDRVRRSKPFLANVSKGHWCFPARLAAGSSSAISRAKSAALAPVSASSCSSVSAGCVAPNLSCSSFNCRFAIPGPFLSKTIRSDQGKRFLTRRSIEFHRCLEDGAWNILLRDEQKMRSNR